jgi:RNA recognition motif-containing protein
MSRVTFAAIPLAGVIESVRSGVAMKRIYVGNVGPYMTEASLRAVFEAYGRVAKIQIRWDFALIDMENEGAARRAVSELNSRTTWALRRLKSPFSGATAA